MKPKILIIADEGYKSNLCHYIVNSAYGEAISKAGGLPLVSLSESIISDYFELCDGIFITDGAFVHASSYGEYFYVDKELPELSRNREIMDFTLLELAVKNKKPVLSIGRGLNVINSYFGGKLKEVNLSQVIDKLSDDLLDDKNLYMHRDLPIYAIDCTPDKLKEYSEFIAKFISACKGGKLWKNR